MKKDLAIIGGLFLAIVLLLIFGGNFTSTSFLKNMSSGDSSKSAVVNVNPTLKIDNLTLNIIVASSDRDQKKGLSQREGLPINQGMLFVFDSDGLHPIWMKNMKFAIDIFWIDSNKRIVDVITDVPPEPGKSDKDLKIYNPRSNNRYVLETNAGMASLNNIKVGDLVQF